ncbi:hypothetical protein ACFL1B_02080 [Nanoarchaeota archaeon]
MRVIPALKALGLFTAIAWPLTACEQDVDLETVVAEQPVSAASAEESRLDLSELEDEMKNAFSLGIVPESWGSVTQVVSAAFDYMDEALASKDLPAFMEAYRTAFSLTEIMDERIEYEHPAPFLGMTIRFRTELTQELYGNVFGRIASDPSILEDWPTYCGVSDSRVQELFGDLLDFVSRKTPDLRQRFGSSEWTTYFDDEALAQIRNEDVSPEVSSYQSQRFMLPGTYSTFSYSIPAESAVFTSYETSKEGLESNIFREVDAFDLGMDGIDACDARLNGLSPEDIPSANQQLGDALETTIKVLDARYDAPELSGGD